MLSFLSFLPFFPLFPSFSFIPSFLSSRFFSSFLFPSFLSSLFFYVFLLFSYCCSFSNCFGSIVFVVVPIIIVFVVVMLIFVFVHFSVFVVGVVVFLCCYVVKLGKAPQKKTDVLPGIFYKTSYGCMCQSYCFFFFGGGGLFCYFSLLLKNTIKIGFLMILTC